MNLIEKDEKFVWHPFTPVSKTDKPLEVVSAQGVYLYTQDGRKILDAIGSWWTNLHGHANPHIAQAISHQAHTLEHVIFAGFTHEPAVKLSETVLSLLPDNQRKVFFSDNGSTACEVAIKMAFQYWHNQGIEKRKVIALEGAYHGDTFGAMSVGGRGVFHAPFVPYLFDVQYINIPKLTHSSAENEKIVEDFRQLAKTGEVGVFMYEPLIQGSAGMRMYSPEILTKILKIAEKYKIITIADEVMTGFGRTGKMFASEYCAHQPDLFCLSKGLTGGALPLGLTTCSERILEAYQTNDLSKTFFHGHSFTANPIACACSNASLELLLSPDCQANIQRISQRHTAFKESIRQHPKVRDVRSLGTVLAVEIKAGETFYLNENRTFLYQFFLKKDMLLRPLGNIIYLIPPYIISDEELERLYGAIQEVLEEIGS